MPNISPPTQPEIVTMMPDCTLRAIDAAYQALRRVPPSVAAVRVDCGGVEHADIAFAQLIASAHATFAERSIPLTLDPVSACVCTVFTRSGIAMPVAEQNLSS